jgi:hypothetical protein
MGLRIKGRKDKKQSNQYENRMLPQMFHELSLETGSIFNCGFSVIIYP